MSNIYTIREFAKRVNRTTTTLRRWDESGVLPAKRTAGNQRYYDESDLRKALRIELPDVEKKAIVYCRVSSKGQADDLASQAKAMQDFCLGAGIAVDEWIEETGGGMNFKRKKFLEIMKRIEHGEISKLVIAHKDRLVRFGFDYFDSFAEQHGCKIVVANQEQLSPQQEMVEDLMAIVHTFSCRLYGLRSYKKQIQKAATGESNADSI
jgi:predicted site-specific integrase-resolvase